MSMHEEEAMGPPSPVSLSTPSRMNVPNIPLELVQPSSKTKSVTFDCQSSSKSETPIKPLTTTEQQGETRSSSPLESELCRFETELQNRINEHGACHPKVAETMNVLGLYHRHMAKDLDKALWYHKQALNLLTSWKGGSVVEDTAVTLTDIGSIQDLTGDYNGALNSFSEALQIFENVEPKLDESDPRMFSILRCMDRVSRKTHSRR